MLYISALLSFITQLSFPCKVTRGSYVSNPRCLICISLVFFLYKSDNIQFLQKEMHKQTNCVCAKKKTTQLASGWGFLKDLSKTHTEFIPLKNPLCCRWPDLEWNTLFLPWGFGWLYWNHFFKVLILCL